MWKVSKSGDHSIFARGAPLGAFTDRSPPLFARLITYAIIVEMSRSYGLQQR